MDLGKRLRNALARFQRIYGGFRVCSFHRPGLVWGDPAMTILFAVMAVSVQKNPLAALLLSKLVVLALGVVKQFILYIVCCFIALLAHEAAHATIALALGVKVKKFGLSWHGPYLVRDPGSPLKNLLITLAGPLVNIILIATWFWLPTFAITNLLLAVSNMLPIRGSDGARACVLWMRAKDSGPC